MKPKINITVIIPIHEIRPETDGLMKKAIDSILNQELLPECVQFVFPPTEELSDAVSKWMETIQNETLCIMTPNVGKTDFCSQINLAASICTTEWFSILEYDDEYSKIWFSKFKEYQPSHIDAEVFLPISTVALNDKPLNLANQPVWAKDFSNKIGYMDIESLEAYFDYSMTGGIFKTETFNKVGGLKPSIQISFWYEFLLRLHNEGYYCYVIPKLGYKHAIGREGSLFKYYQDNIPPADASKWIKLAKEEYYFKNDRGKTIADVMDDNATINEASSLI